MRAVADVEFTMPVGVVGSKNGPDDGETFWLVSTVAKKRNLSLMIGPPTEAPNWRRTNGDVRRNAVSRPICWSR